MGASLLRSEKEHVEMSTAGKAPTDSDWRAANADMISTTDASQDMDVDTGVKVSSIRDFADTAKQASDYLEKKSVPTVKADVDAEEKVPEDAFEQADAAVQSREHTKVSIRLKKRVNAWLAWKALVTKHGRGNTKAMKEKQAKGDEKKK